MVPTEGSDLPEPWPPEPSEGTSKLEYWSIRMISLAEIAPPSASQIPAFWNHRFILPMSPIVIGRTPFCRTSNGLGHQFLNIEQIRSCLIYHHRASDT